MGTIDDFIGSNFDVVIECLGPADPDQLTDVFEKIEAIGGHYVSVPPIPGEFPYYTFGATVEDEIRERQERIYRQIGF